MNAIKTLNVDFEGQIWYQNYQYWVKADYYWAHDISGQRYAYVTDFEIFDTEGADLPLSPSERAVVIDMIAEKIEDRSYNN